MQIYTVRISTEVIVVVTTVSENVDYAIWVNEEIVRVGLKKLNTFSTLRGSETKRIIVPDRLK